MPELPEVETVRRALHPLVDGRRIVGFRRFSGELRYPIPDLGFAVGWQLGTLIRRGKYLLLGLKAKGEAQGRLLLHLGMSGSLRFLTTLARPHPHDRWLLELDNGLLLYRDPRKFGRLSWFDRENEQPLLQLLCRIGPEPLDPQWTASQLFTASRRCRQSVKVWLLAGRAVCGVGNIYACESLFLAAVDPFPPAMGLSWGECVRLASAIRAVLSRAVVAGGTTLRDFHSVDGQPGYFGQRLWVYGREGGRCPRCRGAVHRQQQQGRSTFFCPHCQGSSASDGERLLSSGAVREPAHRHPELPFGKTNVALRVQR